MTDWLLTMFLYGAGMCCAFWAGLRWRDAQGERERDVLGAAVCGLDERLSRIERLHELSTDACGE